MKITTQRTVLWLVNFSLLIGLLGFVFLMAQRSGKQRTKERDKYVKQVDEAVKTVKLKRVNSSAGESDQAWARFRTFLDKKAFVFEGYIPPKPPVDKGSGPRQKAKAPDLSSLIEVHMILAPQGIGAGNDVNSRGGAFVKITSLPKKENSKFYYRIGDVIGIGQEERPDEDPKLKRWGPCRLVGVTSDGIICGWNKERDEAKVKILLRPEPKDVWVEGRGIALGGPGVQTGKNKGGKKMVDLVNRDFVKSRETGGKTVVEWTPAGIDALLDKDTENLFDKIQVKELKSKKGSGLQISAIPARLRQLGLQAGDVVISMDGRPVKNKASATNYVRSTYKRKSKYDVVVLRNGKERSIQVDVPRRLQDARNVGRGVKFGN